VVRSNMKTLVDGYSFFFYRLWRWHRKYFGDSDLPHLNATLHLGLLMLLNWMTLALLIQVVTGLRLTSWGQNESIVTVVIIGLVQYGLFFHHGRYRRIIKRFQEEDAVVSRSVNFVGKAYPIVTFAGLIVAGILSWRIDRR